MPSPADPRAVPYSHKKKRKQLLTKRALKRGEEVPDYVKTNGTVPLDRSHRQRSVAQDVLELRSRFIAIPNDYAIRTRDAAWADVLTRPIPDSSAEFPLDLVDNPAGKHLSVPSRPPFEFGQTKREVEANEEAVYRKWLENARDTVETWMDGDDEDEDDDVEEDIHTEEKVAELRSPSSFETNLEVWRQLWRVVEASSIVLLLVDARCPPVHCPPSLRAYLRSLRPRREIILVLTKTDLVDPEALSGWRKWLKEWWMAGPSDGPVGEAHEPQVVSVTSYDTSLLYGEGRARLRPHIPDSARAALLSALQTAHSRLLEPPASVKADPAELAEWKPSVRKEVHWSDLEGEAVIEEDVEHDAQHQRHADGEHVHDGAAAPVRDPQLEPLTFGLVGQPNVGKSSLLNALLGTTRVRASKTPGKTKHWQTILWGPRREVRIVDCPGLVCPSLVPMELQAMSGILPIAQIPSLPACIAFAAKYIPMELVFRIPPPPVVEDDIDSKRTWRGPRPVVVKPKGPRWTAGEIMDGRATDRGFMTAKSARPDANRAADGMMRALAEGRVRWGFWPPGTTPKREGQGLWLGEYEGTAGETDSEPEHHMAKLNIKSDEEVHDVEEEEEEEESEEETEYTKANRASFFAALSPDEDDDDDDEDEGLYD